MSSSNNLEIKGNLRECPLAEILIEIGRAKLNGSLRVSDAAQKTVVYFDAGDVVFAVSNARASRLFEILLRAGRITKESLLAVKDFTSDLALREHLLKNNSISKAEMDAFFVGQIEEILRSASEWREGEWTFSPLVRVKGDIRFQIDLNKVLIEYARRLPDALIAEKLKNSREAFGVKPAMPIDINLLPEEAFVFSRFDGASLTIGEINSLSGLPDVATRRVIYALWLGGFLSRNEWSGAFSDSKTLEILSANLTLRKEEKPPVAKQTEAKSNPAPSTKILQGNEEIKQSNEETKPNVTEISLDEYLEQVEKSTNFYESLNVSHEAEVSEIKQTYFGLAKRFHPDLFHKTADKELHSRIQNAFSQVAQAYETLKTESSREVYDFRMRKELAEIKKRQATVNNAEKGGSEKQTEMAAENFEQGFSLLMDEDYETAIPFLARAAHLAADNARYRAYYGKALSADKKQRHKAEAELLTAIRLDSANADWRLMLAEFFVEVGFVKRAEGELKRLLTIFPGNREAKTLLDSLPRK